MKAKEYKSITFILSKKHNNKHFYSFMDFGDCQKRINQSKKGGTNEEKNTINN